MSFVLRVLVTGLAIWLTSLFIDDHFQIVGSDTAGGKLVIILAVALLYSLVNAVIKPIVQVLSIPLYILTLGLFTLVVNALMLMLTAWITEQTDWGIRIIGGFWWALLAALIISLLNFAISAVVPKRRDD
ncbi:phage holin family protein [Cellulosimicrobium arenosum]|uniref:Phage holin family protein n=1 Tax=Cellulosimicrobium arenosum TaxID=2708133 RepID=A0A927PF70_9MICO|nr:phage holin family protein [Cellulosimicrobium arenosum]MBD8079670.1 phage holin family protein [Cellulosimicrobium arenosum]